MIKGIKASQGYAIGQVYLFSKEIKIEKYRIINSDMEIKRLETAIDTSISQLNDIRLKSVGEIGEESAAIFEAHIMILEDPEFIPEIKGLIADQKLNSEYAVLSVTQKYYDMFAGIEDDYLRERAADIKDISQRLISNLTGQIYSLSNLPDNCIIVAQDLSPSDTIQMDKSKVFGFLTDFGGVTSHVAIIARTLEIPAIVGLSDITDRVKNGDAVIVDGVAGEVLLNPDNSIINEYINKRKEFREHRIELKDISTLEAVTLDGRKVELEANIGTPEDVDSAVENGAEGIGLFRTEFLYMDRNNLPSEDEQFEVYKKVAAAMGNNPVTIRTLDIGGDKDLPCLGIEKEENPFLGFRAIRFCLNRRDIFKTQLKAILRAGSYGNIQIMYPMISDIEEIGKASRVLEEAKQDLLSEGKNFNRDLQIGVMIETPSAALTADIIAKEVDFFSIGTNDLTQYTLAVDRGNHKVSDYYNPFNIAVLRLIKFTIDESHKNGKYTAMCGEMAGDPGAVKILLGLELDRFSMSASSIPVIKHEVRKSSFKECRELAKRILRY